MLPNPFLWIHSLTLPPFPHRRETSSYPIASFHHHSSPRLHLSHTDSWTPHRYALIPSFTSLNCPSILRKQPKFAQRWISSQFFLQKTHCLEIAELYIHIGHKRNIDINNILFWEKQSLCWRCIQFSCTIVELNCTGLCKCCVHTVVQFFRWTVELAVMTKWWSLNRWLPVPPRSSNPQDQRWMNLDSQIINGLISSRWSDFDQETTNTPEKRILLGPSSSSPAHSSS